MITSARRLLVLVLLVGVSLSSFAIDFGGSIDNSTSVTYTFKDADAYLFQKDRIALWLVSELTPSLKLSIQGSFTYTYENPRPEFPYLPDLDFLTLQGSFPLEKQRTSLLSYTVGRFGLTDFSGLVLSDGIDGFKIDWNTWLANTSLAVGYSGLQFDQSSTINISWADFNNNELFAPPRMIGLLAAEFPEVFLKQSLFAAFLIQQDFRPKNEILSEGPGIEVTGQGGRLSTQYLGVGLNGRIMPALYYQAFAYVGTGKSLSYIDSEYQYAWILSTLVGTAVRYFNEEAMFTKAELRLLFASGDADFNQSVIEGNREGLATVFVPISSKDLALVFSPRLANLVLLEASYSVKPLDFLQTLVKGIVFLRPTAGPISDLRVDGDSFYLGSEIDAIVRFRPFSDLGLALSCGLFFPGQEAFTSSERDPEFEGRLEISFSF